MQVPAGSNNVQASIYCRSTAGTALAGKVAADFALTYRRDGANVPIVLSNLAALTDAHTDGGIKEFGNSEYRLDLPDAAVAAGVTQVTVSGTVDGGVVLGYPIALDTSPSAGTGARVVVFTVTDSVTLAAISDATVRLYRTGSLDRVVSTNASGVATLYCDVDATWSYTVTHPTYTGATGTQVVDGNEAVSVALTVAFIAPSEAGFVTGYWKTYGQGSEVEAGVTHYLQIQQGPGTAGISLDNAKRSAVSGGDGVVQFLGIPWGAAVVVWRGTSKPQGPFTAPSSGTTWAIDGVLGSP